MVGASCRLATVLSLVFMVNFINVEASKNVAQSGQFIKYRLTEESVGGNTGKPGRSLVDCMRQCDTWDECTATKFSEDDGKCFMNTAIPDESWLQETKKNSDDEVNVWIRASGWINSCPYDWHEVNGKCYMTSYEIPDEIIHGQMATVRSNAATLCEEMNEKAHLPKIENEVEAKWITTHRPGWSWIGLNDIAEEGKYVWHDGSSKGLLLWGQNEGPKNQANAEVEDGVCITDDGEGPYYRDVTTVSIKHFVCELAQKSLVVFPTTIDGVLQTHRQQKMEDNTENLSACLAKHTAKIKDRLLLQVMSENGSSFDQLVVSVSKALESNSGKMNVEVKYWHDHPDRAKTCTLKESIAPAKVGEAYKMVKKYSCAAEKGQKLVKLTVALREKLWAEDDTSDKETTGLCDVHFGAV